MKLLTTKIGEIYTDNFVTIEQGKKGEIGYSCIVECRREYRLPENPNVILFSVVVEYTKFEIFENRTETCRVQFNLEKCYAIEEREK